MEAKAVARYVRVSPRKARIVLDQIRGKEVPAAIRKLCASLTVRLLKL